MKKTKTDKKEWREGDLIDIFGLTRITTYQTSLMQAWLQVDLPTFTDFEQTLFDKTLQRGIAKIAGWSEEDLKMKFLTYILELGNLIEDDYFATYFDKSIAATVDGIDLSVKSDFMMAKGILDVLKTPYFHFQEYKPNKNPKGDSMAQLLEAFLIAQTMNQNKLPLYGAEVVGAIWKFVVMEERSYCISKSYDSTDRDDLLQIIAILRHFKQILIQHIA